MKGTTCDSCSSELVASTARFVWISGGSEAASRSVLCPSCHKRIRRAMALSSNDVFATSAWAILSDDWLEYGPTFVFGARQQAVRYEADHPTGGKIMRVTIIAETYVGRYQAKPRAEASPAF
jgi:hypothetical protein